MFEKLPVRAERLVLPFHQLPKTDVRDLQELVRGLTEQKSVILTSVELDAWRDGWGDIYVARHQHEDGPRPGHIIAFAGIRRAGRRTGSAREFDFAFTLPKFRSRRVMIQLVTFITSEIHHASLHGERCLGLTIPARGIGRSSFRAKFFDR